MDLLKFWTPILKRMSNLKKPITRRTELTTRQKMSVKYDSSYQVQAIEHGSLGNHEDVVDEVKHMKNALKQRYHRLPEEYKKLESVQSMMSDVDAIKPNQLKSMKDAAMAASLLHRYMQSPFSGTGKIKEYVKDVVKQAREAGATTLSQEFVDKYGTIREDTMVQFINFMEAQHSGHIGDFYVASERVVEFINLIGRETWNRLGEQRAMELFYNYQEEQENIRRLNTGW